MKKNEVLAMLEQNKDERGITHWTNKYANKTGLKSFGIGLTRLRKLAKLVGKDHQLAKTLWQSNIYDVKIMSLLIDDPKEITRQQAEAQVEELAGGHLAHVFSSCDARLAKVPFVVPLIEDWVESNDPIRRGCGYGLTYEHSKVKTKNAPTDEWFLKHIERIEQTFQDEDLNVLCAMGSALMGIGKRNIVLNSAALSVAQKIGPIDFDASGKCDPIDITKHLTSDYIKKKLFG